MQLSVLSLRCERKHCPTKITVHHKNEHQEGYVTLLAGFREDTYKDIIKNEYDPSCPNCKTVLRSRGLEDHLSFSWSSWAIRPAWSRANFTPEIAKLPRQATREDLKARRLWELADATKVGILVRFDGTPSSAAALFRFLTWDASGSLHPIVLVVLSTPSSVVSRFFRKFSQPRFGWNPWSWLRLSRKNRARNIAFWKSKKSYGGMRVERRVT